MAVQWRDAGLLILRVGLGGMFIAHGLPKMGGGPKTWEALGGAIGTLGVDQGHVYFGFAAAFAETVGGLMLVLGVGVRAAAFLLVCTMIVATSKHLAAGDKFALWSHAAEDGIAFLALMLTGGGRYTLDRSRWSR